MIYNLTDNQKELARWILGKVREGTIGETFTVEFRANRPIQIKKIGELVFSQGRLDLNTVTRGSFDALVAADLLRAKVVFEENRFQLEVIAYTIAGQLSQAVEANFAEEATSGRISAPSQPHPPEIAMSVDRLRERYPDPKKLGFLIMRFAAAKPFEKIVNVIQQTGVKHGLTILRADAHEFHSGLLENVRTYLHGCGFGVAVYERIETDEPSANVGLEVGYLMAMNKPVLLLKDKTVPTLHTDLAGKLYKPFDPHDPEGTIPNQLTKWLEDYGIIVPKRS